MDGNGDDPDLALLSQHGFLQVDDDEEWVEKSTSDESRDLNSEPDDDLDLGFGNQLQADTSSSSSEDVHDSQVEPVSSSVWQPGESGGPWFLTSHGILESCQALIANVFLSMKSYRLVC